MTAPTRQRGSMPTALLRAMADGGTHRTADLAESLALSGDQVSYAATRLAMLGYLERHAAGHYQLTPAGLEAARSGVRITSGSHKVRMVRNSLRQRAWRAMRVRNRFTVGDLVSDAAREGEDGYRHIQQYLWQLQAAGYVTPAGRTAALRRRSNGYRIYALARNTGPLAPVFRAAMKLLHDPNTGRDVPCRPHR